MNAQADVASQAPAKEVAVLFVHGIGDQARGSTLKEFGVPLIDSAGRWLGAGRVEEGGVSGPVDGEPAHATVDVHDDERTLSVLTAEAWWASEFRAPGYRALLCWLAVAVPFVVQRIVDGGLRRSTKKMKKRGERARRSGLVRAAGEGLIVVALAALRLVQNVIALIVTGLLMTGLIAVGLLTFSSRLRTRMFTVAGVGDLTPLGPVLRLIADRVPRWVRDILVRYIGDSYALLRDTEAGNAMVDRVECDLHWLEARMPSAPVVIIAHSQGAELARRVLSRRDPGKPVASLITFGAGIEKLAAVDLLRKNLRLAWTAIVLRIVSAAALVTSIVAAVGSAAPWIPVLGLTVAFAALAAARQILVRVVGEEYTEDRLGVTQQQLTHWLDLHASHDLVSEGSLPVEGFGDSRTIVNRRSLLLDHISYWQNVEAFRAAVALELARAAHWPGVTTQLPSCVVAAAAQRAKRVWWLTGSHIAVAVAAVAAGVLLARDLGEPLARVARSIDGGLGSYLLDGWRPPAIGGMLIALLAAGLAALASRVWNRWSHGRTDRLLTARAG
jgi:hypothetical protein